MNLRKLVMFCEPEEPKKQSGKPITREPKKTNKLSLQQKNAQTSKKSKKASIDKKKAQAGKKKKKTLKEVQEKINRIGPNKVVLDCEGNPFLIHVATFPVKSNLRVPPKKPFLGE